MRLFFALELPEALKAALAELQARGRRAGLAAAWPDPAALHLTLAFLGEQDPAALPDLCAAAQAAAAACAPLTLRTGSLGGFPDLRRARVAWLGLEPSPDLAALAEDLRSRLREAGIGFDPKPFRPHLTVARLRGPASLAALGEVPTAWVFHPEELVLFQSHLGRGGARHEPLVRLRLGAPPP